MQLDEQANDAQSLRVSVKGIVVPGGEFTHEPFEAQYGPEVFRRCALLGLREVEMLNSAGVSWLLTCHRRFEEAGGMLVLHSIPPMVMHTLKLLRMDRALHLVPREADALAMLEAKEP